MNSAMTILFPLLFLLVLGAFAMGAIYLVMRVRNGQSVDLSFRALVTAYFYLMTIVSFVVLLIGLSLLTNAGLSAVLGRDFSYRAPAVYVVEPVKLPPPPDASGRPQAPEPAMQGPSIEEQEERRRQQLRKGFEEGLLRGASLATVGGLVWVLHLWGRRRLEANGGRRESFFFHKAYLAVLLATASLVAILTLPFGVYETLRYYIVDVADKFDYRDPPGGTLSTALVFTPVWAYYLRTLLRELRRSEAG